MAGARSDRGRDVSRLTAALERMPDLALVIVDPDLEVQAASVGALDLLGAAQGSLPSLVDPEYAPIVASLVDRAVRARGRAVEAVCAVPVDGTAPRRLDLVARDLRRDPAVAGIAVSFHDVTDWAEREASYRAALHQDPLTGLGNRHNLLEHLAQAVRTSATTGPRAAVLMVDIDSFKSVNDRYGHHKGDGLLEVVANRLVEVVDAQGSVYRVGGDEFAVLLDKASEEEAAQVAAAAIAAVGLPLDPTALPGEAPPEVGDNGPLEVAITIGIAMFDPARRAGVPPVDTANGMLRDAYTAMYRGKAAGRKRTELFRPGLKDWALIRKTSTEALADQVQQLIDENRALAEAASIDYRTGLANTATFDADHEQLHTRLVGAGERYSILLVDIDHFHDYNSAYGYLQGNDALSRVAATLSSALRQGDRAYRYGGEEFAALLPGARLDGAALVAERTRRAVEDLHMQHPTNQCGMVTVTVGALEALPGHAKAADAFDAVNALLLEGKDAGRNRVVVPRDRPTRRKR